ncbi:MAG TPA: mechanosensitive ion channel family protein, partial [Planctomycetota bacterium]|nr:mechanosensitive ion channel family protein [Planctomycetota bacterium]
MSSLLGLQPARIEEILLAWSGPVGIVVAAALGGFLVKAILLRRLRALFAKTQTRLDDLLINAIQRPLLLWFVLAGIAIAARTAPLSPDHRDLLRDGVRVAFLASVTLALARFAADAIRTSSVRMAGGPGSTSLAANLVRALVMGMGALLILTNLRVEITPVLTALGVGSLAVALALQDTLSNLFAGIQVTASHMVEVGDYVRLDSGQEGRVVDVGWRFTRLREPADNDILVPNAKLAQAIVVNYEKPSAEVAVPVPLGVGYGADLEQVERVALEVAREVQAEVEGAVRGFAPGLAFQTLGDSSIGFTVVLRAATFPGRGKIVHEFVKRAHARFAREGIAGPHPQRVVHLHEKLPRLGVDGAGRGWPSLTLPASSIPHSSSPAWGLGEWLLRWPRPAPIHLPTPRRASGSTCPSLGATRAAPAARAAESTVPPPSPASPPPCSSSTSRRCATSSRSPDASEASPSSCSPPRSAGSASPSRSAPSPPCGSPRRGGSSAPSIPSRSPSSAPREPDPSGGARP